MTMSSNDEAFMQEIGETYRLQPLTQIMLFITLVTITIIILEILQITFDARVTVLLVTATFLFPVIIKKRTRITRAISLGLFLSSMTLMVFFALSFAPPLWPLTQTTTLLIASFLAISVLLFQYLMPDILQRNVKGYLMILAVSLAFTTLVTMSFNLLPPFGVITVWSVVVFAGIAIVFTYAILPEKPI